MAKEMKHVHPVLEILLLLLVFVALLVFMARATAHADGPREIAQEHSVHLLGNRAGIDELTLQTLQSTPASEWPVYEGKSVLQHPSTIGAELRVSFAVV